MAELVYQLVLGRCVAGGLALLAGLVGLVDQAAQLGTAPLKVSIGWV